MTDKKISELTAIDSVVGTDLLPIVDDSASATKKATAAQVKDYIIGLANTWTATQTISGGGLVLSGNISSAAWTTNGVRLRSVPGTLTDTSSSGTVAAAYTNVLGGNTIAASNATTFTDYFTTFINPPSAGTNVTLTRRWALGLGGDFQIANNNTFSFLAGGIAASSSTFPTIGNNELIASASVPLNNVLALRNTSSTGYAAIAFRDDQNAEKTAVGFGNSGTNNVFTGTSYIQSWSDSTPPPFQVTLDGNYGATGSGFRFYRRFSIDSSGLDIWRLIPWGTTQETTLNISAATGLAAFAARNSQSDVMTIRNRDSNGYSTVAYKDANDNSRVFLGFANSGANITALQNNTYLMTFNGGSTPTNFLIGSYLSSWSPTAFFVNSGTKGLSVMSDGAIQFSSNDQDVTAARDVFLRRDAANTLALRNGTSAQQFNVYNTWTSFGSGTEIWERFRIFAQSGGAVILGTQKGANGGTARALEFQTDGTTRLTIASTTGNVTTTGSVTTAAPAGGTAAAWKLGTVATVSPTSPNRTIEVDIGGTIYYISAKTTND